MLTHYVIKLKFAITHDFYAFNKVTDFGAASLLFYFNKAYWRQINHH